MSEYLGLAVHLMTGTHPVGVLLGVLMVALPLIALLLVASMVMDAMRADAPSCCWGCTKAAPVAGCRVHAPMRMEPLPVKPVNERPGTTTTFVREEHLARFQRTHAGRIVMSAPSRGGYFVTTLNEIDVWL